HRCHAQRQPACRSRRRRRAHRLSPGQRLRDRARAGALAGQRRRRAALPRHLEHHRLPLRPAGSERGLRNRRAELLLCRRARLRPQPHVPAANRPAAAGDDSGLAMTPHVPMLSLDTLWFQVAGTICNITCTHCFISCSPKNHSHEMLSLAQVQARLDEARALGVREYYFTGGEPFLNRDMIPILAARLKQGPATVLTNGMLLRKELCRRLRELADASEYSLDIRVSLDGFDAASHDAIRGAGVWDRVMIGLRNLAEAGINPS